MFFIRSSLLSSQSSLVNVFLCGESQRSPRAESSDFLPRLNSDVHLSATAN